MSGSRLIKSSLSRIGISHAFKTPPCGTPFGDAQGEPALRRDTFLLFWTA